MAKKKHLKLKWIKWEYENKRMTVRISVDYRQLPNHKIYG